MAAQLRFLHHREFTRVRPGFSASVTINDATLYVPVRDICLAGISIDITTSVEAGVACTVELRREDVPGERWITAHGMVVRVSNDVAAIHFVDLLGVDSLDHLRGLILYHAEDPDQVMAEFDAHWGLRPKVPTEA